MKQSSDSLVWLLWGFVDIQKTWNTAEQEKSLTCAAFKKGRRKWTFLLEVGPGAAQEKPWGPFWLPGNRKLKVRTVTDYTLLRALFAGMDAKKYFCSLLSISNSLSVWSILQHLSALRYIFIMTVSQFPGLHPLTAKTVSFLGEWKPGPSAKKWGFRVQLSR